MAKGFWNSEKLMSVAALLVSLMTFAVFVYQTNLIRKQEYRSVYPHLSMTNMQSGSLQYFYSLRNVGIGPALIIEVTVQDSTGRDYEDAVEYILEHIDPAQDSIWFTHSDVYPGRLIPAGEEIDLFALYDEQRIEDAGLPPNTREGSNKLWSVINSGDFIWTVVYESIYGERWKVSNKMTAPEEL